MPRHFVRLGAWAVWPLAAGSLRAHHLHPQGASWVFPDSGIPGGASLAVSGATLPSILKSPKVLGILLALFSFSFLFSFGQKVVRHLF